jgi:hypothetical protein
MSVRESVRSAVQAYLAPDASNIANLGNVYSYPAKFTPEGDFYLNEDPGHSTGAVIFIYLGRQSERRIALGGAHNGEKRTSLEIVLDCFIRSTSNKAEDCGLAADQFLDDLVDRIRADRTAGAPSVIFQWGEGDTVGGTDIEVQCLYPKTINGSAQVTQVYASVRTTVITVEHT